MGDVAHHPFVWRQLAAHLLGDNCGVHDYMAQNARTLLATAPGLFPWMSTNPDIEAQAKAPMPLLTTQNYPFLYQVKESEPAKRRAFCSRLELDRECANRYDMALWPFVSCCDAVSPSQLRFQVFASVACGAHAIWYFHYQCNIWDPKTERPGPLYDTAKACNSYIASVIGPRAWASDAPECSIRQALRRRTRLSHLARGNSSSR